MGDGNTLQVNLEEMSGEGLYIRFGNPRRAEPGVDVARQHVLGLDRSQSLDVARVQRTGLFGKRQLVPHIAGKIRIGGLPGPRLRIGKNEVAKFGDHVLAFLAVKLADEGQIDGAAFVERHQQALLGAGNRRHRRITAHHVLAHDGGLGGLAGFLVVDLQRHDQHGVGVFAELDQIGHTANETAVSGLAQGGLVDGSVGQVEAIISPIELTAGLAAVFLRPTLILRLQHAASPVAQLDERSHALAGHRAVAAEGLAAIDDRHGGRHPATDKSRSRRQQRSCRR